MNVKSMTGFARTSGEAPPFRWAWELKAVNSKGLDLRLRLPSGFDSLEAEVRSRLSKRLARGACYANLSIQRETLVSEVRINETAVAALMTALARFEGYKALRPLSLDGLLAVRGIVDVVERDDEDRDRVGIAVLAGLDAAIEQLARTRLEEGRALAQILLSRLEGLGRLVAAADSAPGRRPEAVSARLTRLIDDLSGRSAGLDPARLHQEALLMAAKADVTEEIDRLRAHVAAATALFQSDQPIGRRLDFLAQELAREANTLCAKSNDVALTTIGIEMRVEIEQVREQVQNLE